MSSSGLKKFCVCFYHQKFFWRDSNIDYKNNCAHLNMKGSFHSATQFGSWFLHCGASDIFFRLIKKLWYFFRSHSSSFFKKNNFKIKTFIVFLSLSWLHFSVFTLQKQPKSLNFWDHLVATFNETHGPNPRKYSAEQGIVMSNW